MEDVQIKQKFPVGMKAILIFIGLGTLSWGFNAFKMSLYQLGPFLVSGVGATIIELVIAGIFGTIFYGIIKRLKWARKLAIGWYIFSMILMLINLISVLANKDSYYQKILSPEAYSLYLKAPAIIMTSGLIVAVVFNWIIGLIVITYFSRKKDFFVN